MTIQNFLETWTISIKSEKVDENPNMDADQAMDHWKCTLYMQNPKKQMTTYFSMGLGHNGRKPTAADLLDCLASDASSIENEDTFENWASGFGYDTDSRKAYKIWNTIQKEAERLKNFLGERAYKQLLWNVERL